MNIRDLTSPADYHACEELQRITWGREFREVVPPAIMKISQKVGGIAAGAFAPDGEMIGFVFGITGWKAGQPCHWSHMLAVRPDWRDQGIGRRLKEYQKNRLIQNGVSVMYWTFDPLVARNAHLNLCRLGVSIVEYVPDMYGSDEDNALDHVIGTDRFIVEWDLSQPERSADNRTMPALKPVNAEFAESGQLRPRAVAPPDDYRIEIAIPGDIHSIKETNPDGAARWRANTREAFQHYLDHGYRVTGFRVSPGLTFGSYVLQRAGS